MSDSDFDSDSDPDSDSGLDPESEGARDADPGSSPGPDSEVGGEKVDAAVDLDFGADGLVPAIAQDAESGEVLMLAYADERALARTRETGRAHYYSRSREELWEKGATSGHTQAVEEIRVDCDGDALLYLVDQEGGACHTGYRSCFYRTLEGETVGERVFDPESVY